jgi:tetratricopeptide (TPR) repeat protein
MDDRSTVKEGWMGKNWMEAAEQDGIPSAFVVGKEGKIVWIGHPMEDLEEVVGEVVADKFDPQAAAARKARQEADMAKMREAMNSVVQKMQSGKPKEALTELNKVLAENPQFESQLASFKFNLLLQADEPAAYPYARKLAEGQFKDNPAMLNQIAWTIVEDNGRITLKKPDYATAVFVAERAVTASKSEDPMILDTLGYALFKKGDVKKAIEIQEKAVKLLEDKQDIPEEARQEITDRLKMFKKKKAGSSES